nr:MAG: hypothetical protein [Otus scops adenovirus]
MFDPHWLKFLKREADFPFEHPPITEKMFDIALPRFSFNIRLRSTNEFFWVASCSCMCHAPRSLYCTALAHAIVYYWLCKMKEFVNVSKKEYYIYNMSIRPFRTARKYHHHVPENANTSITLNLPPKPSSRRSHLT